MLCAAAILSESIPDSSENLCSSHKLRTGVCVCVCFYINVVQIKNWEMMETEDVKQKLLGVAAQYGLVQS